jgi:hypothetical protein
MARTYPDRHDHGRTDPVRTRLAILAALTLAPLLAPTAALALATHSPGPGHHGSAGTGSGDDHGSSGHGSSESGSSGRGSDDDHGSDDGRAATAAPAAAPPVGSVANRQSGRRQLSTAPLPGTRTSSAPARAVASDSTATDPASAVGAGSAVVVAAVLVLAAMVVAGFRARARLGRLG